MTSFEDLRVVIGFIAVAISLLSYIPYFRGIFLGSIKPHAFSWLIWGLLSTIAFVIQIASKGGIGSWVTASTAAACYGVFILALSRGSREFSKFDWTALVVSVISIAFWMFSQDPTVSIILVTFIDIVGFLPTFRKGYIKPFEESIALYSWSAVKYVLGLLALETFSVSTYLFTATLALANGLFVVMILLRRRGLHF